MGLPPMGPIHRKRLRNLRRPHPLLLLWFMVVWTVTVFILHDLRLETVLFLSILVHFSVTAQGRENVFTFVRFSVPFMLLYTGVGALFGGAGSHVLWQGPRIPMLGTLAVSWDSILNSLTRAIRIWNLLVLMFTFGRMIDSSDIVYWVQRPFHRVALTLSMVLNFIPQLMTERARIIELSKTRGAGSNATRRRDRARAIATVYQTLLQNALERSWLLAESMFIRGYGSKRRTYYQPPKWRTSDVLSMVLILILVLPVVMIQGGLFARWFSDDIGWLIALQNTAVAGLSLMLFWLGGRFRVRY